MPSAAQAAPAEHEYVVILDDGTNVAAKVRGEEARSNAVSEVFRTGGPEAWERPRKIAKRLASKKSRVKRPNTRLNPKAQEESTRIEQFDNAVLDDQFPDYPATEMSLNEGWSLFICMPTPIAYQRAYRNPQGRVLGIDFRKMF